MYIHTYIHTYIHIYISKGTPSSSALVQHSVPNRFPCHRTRTRLRIRAGESPASSESGKSRYSGKATQSRPEHA